MSQPDRRAEAQRHLELLAGPEAVLLDDQWEAIEALLDGQRVLLVRATGYGKSAVYFIATAMLRARGRGPTLLVCPLLALMNDQRAKAEKMGLKVAVVNSHTAETWQDTYDELAAGNIDLLILGPERLAHPEFREEALPGLMESVGLLVCDECHVCSSWGHDFRPDFRVFRTLIPELPEGMPILASTATANSRVVADLAEVLHLAAA